MVVLSKKVALGVRDDSYKLFNRQGLGLLRCKIAISSKSEIVMARRATVRSATQAFGTRFAAPGHPLSVPPKLISINFARRAPRDEAQALQLPNSFDLAIESDVPRDPRREEVTLKADHDWMSRVGSISRVA